MKRPKVKAHSDGTFSVKLDESIAELLISLSEQLDPLLDNPSADPGLRRLFPPAHPDDLMAEAEWQIRQGDTIGNAHRASLEAVRHAATGARLSEEELFAWMQGLNALRLVLSERLGFDGDDEAEEAALEAAVAVLDDEGSDEQAESDARRLLGTWQASNLLALLLDRTLTALD